MAALKRLVTGVVLISVLLVCLTVPKLFGALITLFASLAMEEFFSIIPASLTKVPEEHDFLSKMIRRSGVVLICCTAHFGVMELVVCALVFVCLATMFFNTLFLAGVANQKIEPALLHRTVLGVFANFYIPFLLSHAILLRNIAPSIGNGSGWVLLTIIGAYQGDNGALWFGSMFGRNKLCPAISPNKSVEGAVGAVFLSTVSVVGFVTYREAHPVLMMFPALSTSQATALGAMFGILALCGDLCESCLKRSMDVKDTGSLLPGHGGVLDRIDSILISFPVCYYIVSLLL